jgi:lipopolysaccharide/colanic/teichoic acid biosynthesis glycosyltransferase
MTTLLIIVGAAATVLLLPIVQKLLVSEVEGWLPHLSRRLVEIAARRLPERDRERYLEEWLAELSSFDDRRLTALLWSFDLLRGSRSLRLELSSVCSLDTVALPRMKRVLDLVVAAFAVIAVAPIIALIALVIWLSSPGPILARQRCIGRDGRPFRMLRFRTRTDGPIPTRIGQVLIRTALEELPQFFNVLRGQMSLVGPRPTTSDWRGLDATRRPLHLAPGMTGPWQLSASACMSPTELGEIDEFYVRGWTLWRDIEILLLTPLALLRKSEIDRVV